MEGQPGLGLTEFLTVRAYTPGLRYYRPLPGGTRRTSPLGWWVVKYYDEERIFPPGFDRAVIRTLSDELGLPVLTEYGFDPFDSARRDYFFPRRPGTRCACG